MDMMIDLAAVKHPVECVPDTYTRCQTLISLSSLARPGPELCEPFLGVHFTMDIDMKSSQREIAR